MSGWKAAGRWLLENNGTDAGQLTPLHNLTLTGSPPYVAGHWGTDQALSFNGSTQWASTSGAVLADTSGSFTVAAWVKLTGAALPTGVPTALSQQGSRMSAFYFGFYGPGGGQWALSAKSVDADTGSPTTRALGPVGQPQLNQWTHLAGTYDASTKTLTIYVNGAPAGTAVMSSAPFKATGGFNVGRAKYQGANSDFWPGLVDEVHAFPGVLTAEQIWALAAS